MSIARWLLVLLPSMLLAQSDDNARFAETLRPTAIGGELMFGKSFGSALQ
jgi:hypothetical protein